MRDERIFNLFIYFNRGAATEYGVFHYDISGTDQEKTAHLLSRVDQDHVPARRFALPQSFTPDEWHAILRLGRHLEIFEGAFLALKATSEPLFCMTAIVDGVPTADIRVDPAPLQGDRMMKQQGLGTMPDYLVHYTDGNTFRFIDLINDDYFVAIRTLFNARLYVSCSKLLMSCVDTLAFVEFGDSQRNFSKWVDAYVELEPIGISADELWEFRNSLIHMTNLASRKVIAGQVSPIMPFVGTQGTIPPYGPALPKHFNLFGLIEAIAQGIGRWGETYTADPSKMIKFIERYDTTVSDARLAWVPI